jgi:hypothetical protein
MSVTVFAVLLAAGAAAFGVAALVAVAVLLLGLRRTA